MATATYELLATTEITSSVATFELTGLDAYTNIEIVGSHITHDNTNNAEDCYITYGWSGGYETSNYYRQRLIGAGSGADAASAQTAQTSAIVEYTMDESNNFGNFMRVNFLQDRDNNNSRATTLVYAGFNDGSTKRHSFVSHTQRTVYSYTKLKFDLFSANFTSGTFKIFGVAK